MTMSDASGFVTPPPIACDQFAVRGEGCPQCGGWLYADNHGELSGVPVRVPGGMTVCSEPECAEHERQRVARLAAARTGSEDDPA